MFSQWKADVPAWWLAWQRTKELSGGGPPSVLHDRVRSVSLAMDGIWVLSRGSGVLAGWVWDPDERIDEISLRFPSGASVPLDAYSLRTERDDVAQFLRKEFGEVSSEQHGFVCFIRHSDFRSTSRPYRLIVRFKEGGQASVSRLQTHGSGERIRTDVLRNLPEKIPAVDCQWAGSLEQALSDLASVQDDRERVRSTTCYGELAHKPRVSIVIPLFRTLDLFRAQIACLSSDSSLRGHELIYVVDSPEMQGAFERQAFDLHRLYGLPLKLITLKKNYGYSIANNVGASYARSPYLLFLNSDVFPTSNGWVDQMREFCEQRDNVGALGVKLLYGDESLQHAGMYFSREFFPGRIWYNCHLLKGLARDCPAANETRQVPAVTGACLMVKREVFDRIGCWDESYILANFEDSDFCVRAYAAGLENWYLPTVELYHLEGQSQGLPDRAGVLAKAKLYNCWLQTRRWEEKIGELMARFDNGGQREGGQ